MSLYMEFYLWITSLRLQQQHPSFLGAEAPGKDYSDPASQEIFISSTSGTLSHSLICLSIGSPNGLQENPNTFSSYQKLCQINALAMEKVMQSKACVFWSYPINRLTKGQDQTHVENVTSLKSPMHGVIPSVIRSQQRQEPQQAKNKQNQKTYKQIIIMGRQQTCTSVTNLPHRILAYYKCGTVRLTGYTQITSVALSASQDIHKLQVWHCLPHRIYTNYKCGTVRLTGYTHKKRLKVYLFQPQLTKYKAMHYN